MSTMQIGITERGDAALNDGWVDWVYKKDKPAILITKNAPLLQQKHPDIFFKDVTIHVTCTGLGGTIFEPNVPSYKDILKWVTSKPAAIQRRLVMRADPICPPLFRYEKFDGEKYFFSVVEILKTAKDCNMRARVSFLDMYPHVNQRFHNQGIYLDDYYKGEIHLSLDYRQKMLETFETLSGLKLEICGEPGLECTGCISKKDLDILGLDLVTTAESGVARLACKCLGAKTELLANKAQCPHRCLYCYWK